jgi:hypothetical protein
VVVDMIEQLDEPDVQGSWLELPGPIKRNRNPSVIKEARASAAKACAVVARGPLLRSREGAVFIPRNRLALRQPTLALTWPLLIAHPSDHEVHRSPL